jgi:hypothetical protein
MSSTQNLAQYSITVETGNAEATVSLSVSAPISDTMTDAAFLAIAQALEGAFPASWEITVASGNMQVTKQTDVIETWNANMTASPVVFQ